MLEPSSNQVKLVEIPDTLGTIGRVEDEKEACCQLLFHLCPIKYKIPRRERVSTRLRPHNVIDKQNWSIRRKLVVMFFFDSLVKKISSFVRVFFQQLYCNYVNKTIQVQTPKHKQSCLISLRVIQIMNEIIGGPTTEKMSHDFFLLFKL